MPKLDPTLLAQLSAQHGLLQDLVAHCDPRPLHTAPHPELRPLAWYFVHAVYTEAYWLREVLQGEETFTAPLRPLMHPEGLDAAQLAAALPPAEHLLAWGRQLQDDHLMWLATPGALPEHPLLEEGYLAQWLVQQGAMRYEEMLQVLTQQALKDRPLNYQVSQPLKACGPASTSKEVGKGYFRVGGDPAKGALDLELPPQMVELSAFRITTQPVSNAQYLGFMQAGGYQDDTWWDAAGCAWREAQRAEAPHPWRRDLAGHWFAVGLNGPYDLVADEPVLGVSRHEAAAYARWAASHEAEGMGGAILPHEYQWEVARRLGKLESHGRVWEWCGSPLHRYSGYQPRPEIPADSPDALPFDAAPAVLRGGSLHTQFTRRRPSARHFAHPDRRLLFAGLRLVLPPLPGCGILD